MNNFEISLLVLSLIYSCFIWWCLAGWKGIPEFIPETGNSSIMLTVIIPARNEEESITACLDSLVRQDFPKKNFEVIVVDDDSTDTTCGHVTEFIRSHPEFNCRLLPLKFSQGEAWAYKKQAITHAIGFAAGNLVLTTDADCLLPPLWLRTMVAFYEKQHPVLISAPVVLSGEKTFLEKIQSLEFLGLIGIGAASIRNKKPIMCNGANLAYDKAAFLNSGGYESDGSASGDDTRLLVKFSRQQTGLISFLKSREACVSTKGKNSLIDLLQQRIRWSSKIPSQMSGFTVLTAANAYLLHLGLVAGIFFGFVHSPAWIFAWLLKSAAEFFFLFSLTGFFNKRNLLWYFLPAQLIYPFYIVLAGILAFRGTYVWKGRKQTVRA